MALENNNDWYDFNIVSEEIVKEEETRLKADNTLMSDRLLELENMIIPFLERIVSAGNDDILTLNWPNRVPQIKAQIKKIKKLTKI